MVNQPMMCAAPLFFRIFCMSCCSVLSTSGASAKSQRFVTKTCVSTAIASSPGAAHDDVRRLSSDAGQTFQGVSDRRALRRRNGKPAHAIKTRFFRLIMEQTAGFNIRLDGFRFRLRKRCGIGISGKECGRDHIDLDIRALGGKDNGNEQLIKFKMQCTGFASDTAAPARREYVRFFLLWS